MENKESNLLGEIVFAGAVVVASWQLSKVLMTIPARIKLFRYKRKISKMLKKGEMIEINGNYYKVTIEE